MPLRHLMLPRSNCHCYCFQYQIEAMQKELVQLLGMRGRDRAVNTSPNVRSRIVTCSIYSGKCRGLGSHVPLKSTVVS